MEEMNQARVHYMHKWICHNNPPSYISYKLTKIFLKRVCCLILCICEFLSFPSAIDF
jgi:hypothetical protein